jgi:purine-binding chemotaxis protein CheW
VSAVPEGAPGIRVVTFRIGGEVHGVAVEEVEEVVEDAQIHALPRGGRALLGILRLRGELIPVFDLAPALGLAPQQAAGRMVLVLRGAEHGPFGVAADGAEEVITLGELFPAPAGGGELERLLRGVGREGGKLVTVLDPAGIVPGNTPSAMQADP